MGALYRRFRPGHFLEVVGQEHVKEPLLKAIREGRLAHAYLFSGPRGVGKTTLARLLAQGVVCQAQDPPCGACEACRMVREGTHPDVVEIDAASHNSVEDVRDLREKLHLSPILAKRKIFILDEAHMLSKSAFNALLKTLEEPPPHVLFVFATTEPERMPPTILSRTQHYRFRRLKEEEILEKLRRILEELGREAEEGALRLIARLADGALRDAESLLDRALLLEDPITQKALEEAFGLPPEEALDRLALALERGEVAQVLDLARGLYAQGFAARSLALGLLEALRRRLYRAIEAGRPLGGLPRALALLDERVETLGRRGDALALEVALLEVAQAFQAPGEAPPKEAPPRAETPLREEAGPPSLPHGPEETPPPREDQPLEAWRAFLAELKPTVRAFFREGRVERQGGTLLIRFPPTKAFHHQNAQKRLPEVLPLLEKHLGPGEVRLVLGEENGEAEKKSPLTPPPRPRAEGPAESPKTTPLPYQEPNPPKTRMGPRDLARRLGGRVLWVLPRAEKAKAGSEEGEEEEPLSPDEIGGNGI